MDRAALAQRAGVDVAFVEQLVALGALAERRDGQPTEGDVRRVRVLQGLVQGGIPIDVLAEAQRIGALALEFVEQPSYDRFSAHEPQTFRQVADERAIPIELLLAVREASGSATLDPDDHVRTSELPFVPFLERALRAGVSPASLERTIRVAGDGMRRIAETEADYWAREILAPLIAAGADPTMIGDRTEVLARELGPLTDDALLALYHGQQAHSWMRNIFESFETLLVRAGVYTRLERQPAIAFVDVTGYSRLTEQRGDATAADLAGRVARVVQRAAAGHGGRTIKWLGDGVMLFFPEADDAVAAALDIMAALDADDLPAAHAGIHTGPVLFQEGDYFGRTVNTAARIADYAVQGQVLVSEAVTQAVARGGVRFEPLGAVTLKNLSEPVALYRASR
jgi:adenylate cyclase